MRDSSLEFMNNAMKCFKKHPDYYHLAFFYFFFYQPKNKNNYFFHVALSPN